MWQFDWSFSLRKKRMNEGDVYEDFGKFADKQNKGQQKCVNK